MKRTDETFVYDILIAADSVRAYTRDVSKDDFLSKHDAMIQDAVIRQVGIIGEAVSMLSPAFRARYPSIPWAQIIGMRNIVVHQYWEVNLSVVWEAATEDIPALVKKLSAALSSGRDVGEATSTPRRHTRLRSHR